MKQLTPARRAELRASAHHLSPVVSIAGNGLTPAVLSEIEISLQAHELIKIKTYGADRDARALLMTSVCEALGATPVQHIGNILVVWRLRREEAKKAGADKAAETATKITKQPPPISRSRGLADHALLMLCSTTVNFRAAVCLQRP